MLGPLQACERNLHVEPERFTYRRRATAREGFTVQELRVWQESCLWVNFHRLSGFCNRRPLDVEV